MGKEFDIDLSGIKQGIMNELSDAISDAYAKGAQEGMEKGTKKLKKVLNNQEIIEVSPGVKMIVDPKKVVVDKDAQRTIKKAVSEVAKNNMEVEFPVEARIVTKLQNRKSGKKELLKEIEDMLPTLETAYNSSVGIDIKSKAKRSIQANTKFIQRYIAAQNMGFDEIITPDMTEWFDKLTGKDNEADYNAERKKEYAAYASFVEAEIKKQIQLYNKQAEVVKEVVEEQKKVSNVSVKRGADKNSVLSGDKSSVLSGGDKTKQSKDMDFLLDKDILEETFDGTVQAVQKFNVRLSKEKASLEKTLLGIKEDFEEVRNSDLDESLKEALTSDDYDSKDEIYADFADQYYERAQELFYDRSSAIQDDKADGLYEDARDYDQYLASMADSYDKCLQMINMIEDADLKAEKLNEYSKLYAEDVNGDEKDRTKSLSIGREALQTMVEDYTRESGKLNEEINNITSDVDRLSKIEVKRSWFETPAGNQTEVLSNQTPLSSSEQLVEEAEQDVKELTKSEQQASEEAQNLANTIAEEFGVKSKKTIQKLGIEIDDVLAKLREANSTNMSDDDFDFFMSTPPNYRSILDILAEDAEVARTAIGNTYESYDKLRTYVSKSIIKNDPTFKSEFGDDWLNVRNTIGSKVIKNNQGTDIMVFLNELNTVLGTTFDTSGNAADGIRQLYEALYNGNQERISLVSDTLEDGGSLDYIKEIIEANNKETISIDNVTEAKKRYNIASRENIPQLAKKTPLEDSKAVDAVENAAEEIDEANEEIEASNEEVEESEEELAENTKESRKKSSSAAKRQADETVKANERIINSNKEAAESSTHKIIGTTESKDLRSRTYQDEVGRTFTAGERRNKKTGEWEPFYKELTSYTKFESEAIKITNKLADAYAELEKAQRQGAPTAELDAHQQLVDLLEEEEKRIKAQADAYFKEQGLGTEYTQQVFDERVSRSTDEHALKLQIKTVKEIRKENEINIRLREKEQEAIAKANRYLNTQEKKLEHIEKTYNKALNPDLEKSVTNKSDLNELEKRRNEIQALIAKLKNTPRDASNEQDYLNLEKMIAAYKDLADYKKKANNPTKGELGGQNLETLVSVQINDYKKLIEKAKNFGDQTTANVQLLETQLAILEKVDSNGKHTATADDYYNARDLYKVERSSISLIESQNKGTKTVTEIDKISEALKNLIATEDTYQKLMIKRNFKSLSPEEAKQLAELTEVRKRDNEVLAQHLALTKEQQDLQDKYDTKKSDVKSGMEAYQNTLIEGQLKSYTKFYDSIEANKRNLTPVVEYKEKIDELQISITKLQSLQEAGIDITDSQELAEVRELIGTIETLQYDLRNMKNNVSFQELDTEEANKKLAEVHKTLEKNTKMAKELRTEFKALAEKYQIAIDTKVSQKDLEGLNAELAELQARLQASGKTGNSFFNLVGKKITGMAAQFFAMYLSFQDLLQIMRRGFEVIKEYDKALTEMNKVSNESINTLKAFQKESFALANSIGTTASQIQNSTADFLRLGESFEVAKQSAMSANELFKVAEFGDISEATDALIAMSQAYKELEKSEINDILNYTGNNFSISTSELASALQRSAATLKVAGNDIYEATALVTAGNAVLQDAETVGSGLKMISLRILGTEEAKDELASLGEDVDDFVVQTKSKIDETVRNYTAVESNAFKGISVLDDSGNYRSTYEILRDISQVYQEILEADKKAGTNRGQALLEVLAGKNRSNVAASILSSPELLTDVYEEALTQSQGSVQKELEAQLQSIESHLNQLKNAWDSLWVNENNREVITFFLDLAKGILEAVDSIGVLNTAFIGIGGFLGAKSALSGGGRAKCCPSREYATGEFSSDVYELCVA